MSRIAAALRRAKVGVIAARFPRKNPAQPAPTPPADAQINPVTPVTQVAPVTDVAQVSHAGQVQEPAAAPGEGISTPEPRFHKFKPSYVDKLVVSPSLPQALREQYRRLGATLHHAQAESGIRVLMVTSALPNEGKTLTATNIALTLSESFQRRVLLVDADLRRPSVGDVFQVPKVFGLNEALTSPQGRKVSVIQVSRNLSLLTAGAPHPDPMSLLTSDRMRSLLAEAAAAFDWVVIDTPPIGIITDAKLLGAMADAALLVIRAGKTAAALVQRAVDSIGRNRIIGTVLNRTDAKSTVNGSYYYSSYYGESGKNNK